MNYLEKIKKIILNLAENNPPIFNREIIAKVKAQGIKYNNKIDLMDKIAEALNELVREKKVWINFYDDEITFE